VQGTCVTDISFALLLIFRPLLPLVVGHIGWINVGISGTDLLVGGFTFFHSIQCPSTIVLVCVFSFNCNYNSNEV